MEKQHATVTVQDEADGARIVIQYDDGFTLYMSVGPESIVLRRALGLDEDDTVVP